MQKYGVMTAMKKSLDYNRMVKYNCLDGHLWLAGLDKCARCGMPKDEVQDM